MSSVVNAYGERTPCVLARSDLDEGLDVLNFLWLESTKQPMSTQVLYSQPREYHRSSRMHTHHLGDEWRLAGGGGREDRAELFTPGHCTVYATPSLLDFDVTGLLHLLTCFCIDFNA
jgi:hypothetical protein